MKNKNWEKIEKEFYKITKKMKIHHRYEGSYHDVLLEEEIKDFFKKQFQDQHQQFEDIVKKLNSEIYEDTGITNYCKEILKELIN